MAGGWLSTATVGPVFGRNGLEEEDEAAFEECIG